ncbi:hypothetical protein BH09BAC2_BH09BAC2_02700 [soil metagenome]
MKKFFILATAAFLVSGVSFAHDGGKGKGKKACCKKGGSCCKKKASTANM